MPRKGILVLFFLLLICALSSVEAQTCSGSTCTANSCNETDVANAISSAIGGSYSVVAIPSGTCTWSSNLTSPTSGTFGTLTIKGAGNLNCPSSCDDATTIAMNGVKWYLELGTSGTFRLTGITFESTGTTTYGVLAIQGPTSGTTAPQVRVDHIHGNMTSSTDTTLCTSFVAGVVDHSLFDETASSEGNSAKIFWPENGDSGDQSWNTSTGLGGTNTIYFENNIFNHGVANDGQEGARFVFRFNTFNDASVQTHPTGGDGRGRGARALEIYENTFTATSNCTVECGNVIWMSSGTGVIWGNTANSYYNAFANIHEMRVDNSTYTQTATPNGWGYCGTNFNGTGSAWDQNTNTASGYTCLDQVGRGVGDLIQGQFPNACDKTQGCPSYNGTWPNEALEPVYEWSDSWGGSTGTFSPVMAQANTCSPNCTGGSLIQANRDYYLWCNPSSLSGCTSFNGTVGVGSGPLASAPSTCTPGTAYWATDQGNWNTSGSGGQGELHKCTAMNTWTLYYTPYTYPHPLDTATLTPPPPTLNQPSVAPQ